LEEEFAVQILHHSRTLGVPVVTARSSVVVTAAPRAAARQRVALAARLTWKDRSGAVRFASVTTRDISETGAFVECGAQVPIPLFRLVNLQLEATAGPSPAALQGARTLAAVWRVESPKNRPGAPCGYALRFLVEPTRAVEAVTPILADTMAVATQSIALRRIAS
jgi:hypothetical protein